MKNRWLLTLVAALLVAVLAACSSPGGPSTAQYLTSAEGVDAVDSVMNDAVSIGNGFADSDLDKALQHLTSLPAPSAGMIVTVVPGFYVLFFDGDTELGMSNRRLATGTFDFDRIANDWDYSAAPDGSLVLNWLDGTRGPDKQMELRIAWGDTTTVNTYGDPTLGEREAFEAPDNATVTLEQDGTILTSLEITQQWVSTPACGVLAEASYLNLKGSLGTGASGATIRQLTFDHTMPDTVKLSGNLDARAGSLTLPVSFEVSASAQITRGDDCQINGVSGSLDGRLRLKVGKGAKLAQLQFNVAFEPDGLDNWDSGELTVSKGRFMFGSKRFDFEGGLALPSADPDGLLNAITLTFADDDTNTLLEFIDQLNTSF